MRALIAVLLLCLALPAVARGEAISPPGASKSTLTAGGERFLAVWVQTSPSVAGGAVVARPLSATGRPLGPPHAIALTRPGFSLVMPPSVVWNPRRREFLVAFQATTAAEASVSCGPGNPPYSLPCFDADVEIFTRRVGRDGRPRGRMRRATATGAASDTLLRSMRPSLAYDRRSRRFLLAYTATVRRHGRNELRVQRLAADGARVGGPRRVGRAASEDASGTTGMIAPWARGGWLALLGHTRLGAGRVPNGDLHLQRLTRRVRPAGRATRMAPRYDPVPAGGPLPPVQPYPVPVALADHPRSGGALALWERAAFGSQARGFETRLIGRDGRPSAPRYEIPSTLTWDEVALTPSGRGWALLLTRYVPGGERDVFLGRLSARGRLAGAPVRLTNHAPVPGTPAGMYDNRFVYDPAVAATPRGRLVGLWSEEPEGGAPELHVRRLN